jgi:hypothetical protein
MKRRRITEQSGKYSSATTRFNELPSEIISLVIDFIRPGSPQLINFVLCNKNNIYITFTHHLYFGYHQFKSSIPLLMKCLSDDRCKNLIKDVIHALQEPLDTLTVQQLLPQYRNRWLDWTNGKQRMPAPTLSQQQRKVVYDKFLSRVVFLKKSEPRTDPDTSCKIFQSTIGIDGTDIKITFDGMYSDRGGWSQTSTLEVSFSSNDPFSILYIDPNWFTIEATGQLITQNKLKQVLSLVDEINDNSYNDNWIAIIRFAFPICFDWTVC